MKRYKKIENDKEIIELYKNIEIFEDLNGGWAHHNFRHVQNVAELVERVMYELGYDEEFVEEAKISAILHDVGAIKGKANHAERSYDFVKKYIERKNISLEYKDLVLDAIRGHSSGFDTENVIKLVLIFADKLDIKKTRVAKAGYTIDGMREMQYIEDILVEIQDNSLKVQFICDSKINKKELEEFYFMNKVFKGIEAFSSKMNLKPVIKFNEDIWEKNI